MQQEPAPLTELSRSPRNARRLSPGQSVPTSSDPWVEMPIDPSSGVHPIASRNPRTQSPGRRLLVRALQSVTLVELAQRLGVSFSAVSAWARGASQPKAPCRIALERELGIPSHSWESPNADTAAEVPGEAVSHAAGCDRNTRQR